MEWKCGRSANAVSNWFTGDASPKIAKSVECMHNKTMINHFKNCISAKIHLIFVPVFCTLIMNGMNDDERPYWYRQKTKGRATKKAAAEFQRGKEKQVHSFINPLRSLK